jgi:CBS domain-containing protein
MRVSDVMTRKVFSIRADDTILTAARLMLQNRISGLPVVTAEGELAGMVTEGDFLRRTEIDTNRRRPKWIEFVLGPGRLAEEFTRTSGRKVEEVMSHDPVTVTEDASLASAVELMERNRIKRLPVVRDGTMVGIISRANLVRALVSSEEESKAPAAGDPAIRDQILAAFAAQPWAPRIDVTVKDGIVDLWGTITDNRERKACVVLVQNVRGVKKVHDHIVWVEPMSGMVFLSPEHEGSEQAAPPSKTQHRPTKLLPARRRKIDKSAARARASRSEGVSDG